MNRPTAAEATTAAAAAIAAALGVGAAGCFSCAFEQRCGNGVTDPDETCDDGNRVNGDGCSGRCEVEFGLGYCGDGVRGPGEQCDDGNNQNGDGCTANCFLETFGACGDGLVQLGEECDDGNNSSGDGCDAFCRAEGAAPVCGNGILDPGEFCDTTFGCDPDCVYSCSEAACGEPILEVAYSGDDSIVGTPLVAEGGVGSDRWVVAWLDGAGDNGSAFAWMFQGSEPFAGPTTPGDAVFSLQLGPRAANEYYLTDLRVPAPSVPSYVRFSDDLTSVSLDEGLPAGFVVRTDGRRDVPGTWSIAAYDLYPAWVLHTHDPAGALWDLGAGHYVDEAASAAHAPALALHGDGSITVAYPDAATGDPPQTYLELRAADGSPAPNGVTGTTGPWVFNADGAGVYDLVLEGLAGGGFVAVWLDGAGALRSRYYASDGTPTGAEAQLGVGPSVADPAPAVAADAAGNHVIAWSVDEAGCRRVRAWLLDALGQPYETPFLGDADPFIGSGTDCAAGTPSVALSPDGSLVLAWQGCDPTWPGCPAIRARRFPLLVP
ncbi:MAG TPA: DUF4215 domain-containing protein [Myxococcota bacterium]|jgi:cysteine-rich repeat protein|nr:DUF4215 domain-containing protein [Myxococcota bacterium]